MRTGRRRRIALLIFGIIALAAPVPATAGLLPDSTTTLDGPAAVVVGTQFTLHAEVTSSVLDESGSIEFFEDGNPTPLCTEPITSMGEATCDVDAVTEGEIDYVAVYSGGPLVNGSTSNIWTVTVTGVVEAHDVTVQYTTFYPVADGYRDTNKISGVRDEDATVTIKIHNPGDTVIKTVTLPLASGSYSFTWDGRDASAAVLPEGVYKVVQTLVDVDDNSRSFNSNVTLSRKKLIWHSDSVTKKGSSVASRGSVGDGFTRVNTSKGFARLEAPNQFDDWAAVGWQFTLPTEIAYKSIAVKVYASHRDVGPNTEIGSQDFGECSSTSGDWFESCFDTWRNVGNASGSRAWYSTGTLTASHRSGTKVRAMVTCPLGTTYIYKARVTFQYATLGY